MWSFRAMGTDITVVCGPSDLERVTARVAATFAEAEQRFSRFREDSELSQVNRARGPQVVSPELFSALERARGYYEATDGLFDPAVGATLEALGYDRSFAPGELDRPAARLPTHTGRFSELKLEPATRTVERPAHLHLDLGGMIKGATVDSAAAHLCLEGAIDAGGDALALGEGPDDGAWLVDVEDPTDPTRSVATLALRDSAVATSAANRRVWRVGGARAHHLIDPRTHAPVDTDLLQATVVAPHVELADVLAKTSFLLGSRGAPRLLARHPGVGAVLVRDDGDVRIVGAIDVREVRRG